MPRPNATPIRLFLVDDHEVVRLGLRLLFDQMDTVQIVGEAATVDAAVAEVIRLKPDVVLMDVRLPDGSGVDACREIRAECPATRVLFLTSYSDEEVVFSTVSAGASGYVLKEIGGDTLVHAVETVAKGQSIFDPIILQRVLSQIQPKPSLEQTDSVDALTLREERILALVAEGKTNKEIGQDLGLSDKTVKNHLSVMFQKLKISRRSQAAVLFIKRHTD
jgi:two-component system response regulator DevR